jgi:hypothetical protein
MTGLSTYSMFVSLLLRTWLTMTRKQFHYSVVTADFVLFITLVFLAGFYFGTYF